MREIISAVVPVYNTPALLLRSCVESMLSQSYADSEILLVDDGSGEETRLICDALARENARVTVLHQKNAGPSEARNNGLRHAKGTYLTFVDSDDTVLPGTWQTAVDAMEANQADCAVFGWLDNEQGHPVKKPVAEKLTLMDSPEAVCCIASDNFACGGGYPWNKMWRAAAVRANNAGELPLFDTKLFTYEDKDWILRALDGLGLVVLMPWIGYDYRYVAASLTKSEDSWKKRQYNAYDAYDKILDYLQPKNSRAYRGAANFYFDFCVTDLYNQYRHPSWVGWERCRKTKKCAVRLCRRLHWRELMGCKRRLCWAFLKVWGMI